MKSAKLTLTLLLCLLLCLCLLPTASADDGAEESMGFGEPGFFSYADIEHFPVSPAPLSVSSAEVFESASSVSVTLPKNTKTIGAEAFADCRSMTTLHIPACVTLIAEGAFAGCTSLREIYYDGTVNQALSVDIGANNECFYNAIIYCAGGERIIPIVPRYFPDNTFLSYVYQNFDTDKSGALTNAEIQAVTRISCYGMGISSLKGVEFFTELTFLDCGFNALTELDVTHNTKLESLGFAANSITSIDLSKAPNLRVFSSGTERQESDGQWRTYGNPLTSLDVTHNPKLTYLECPGNGLSVLNISQNPALERLGCWSNTLSALNLSNNTNLVHLACSSNPIASLNLSRNAKLEVLVCQYCDLSSLSLASNANLRQLRCNYNRLSQLDLSGHTKLQRFECARNQLTSINVSGCSALERFNCCYNQVASLNTSGCTALVFADLGANQLTSVAFAGFPKLEYLCIAENQIENLNLRNCSSLIQLVASKGTLKTLDLYGCSALQYLGCWSNRLTSVNLSQNTALKHINLSANKSLTSVTVGSLPNLEMLWLQNTNLSSVNIRNCPIIVQAYYHGTLEVDNGNWFGYRYGEDPNPGSSRPVDHCRFCVDKGVSVIA